MQRFRSKYDTWLVVLSVAATAFSTLAILPLLAAPVGMLIKVMIFGLVISAVVLVAWVFLATDYVIIDGELRIRSGPFRWRVPLAEIHDVRPTRMAWSSPALSLDRLRIDYGEGKWIMVSPENREAFISSLGLKYTGEEKK